MLAVKLWLLRAVCHRTLARLIYGMFNGEIPSRGFRIDPGGTSVSWNAVPRLFWGVYEKAEINMVRKYLRPDLDVVELGASLGVISIHIAHKQAPDRRMVCVEANPELIPVIRRNLVRNCAHKHVELLNMAIHDGSRPEVDFAIATDPLQSCVAGTDKDGPGALANKASVGERICRVKATRLSDILDRFEIQEYALVCDIEGAEASILQKDAESLARCQQLILELHPARYKEFHCDAAGLCARLHELGFECEERRGAVGFWRRVQANSSATAKCGVRSLQDSNLVF